MTPTTRPPATSGEGDHAADPEAAEDVDHPGWGTAPRVSLDVVHPQRALLPDRVRRDRAGPAAAAGWPGRGGVVDALQREWDERGAGGGRARRRRPCEVAEQAGEVGDGGGADLGRCRRGGQLGGGPLQHGEPRGGRPLLGEQQRVVQRRARRALRPPRSARGRRRRSGGSHRAAAAPARRAPGRGRRAARAGPTARRSGGTARAGRAPVRGRPVRRSHLRHVRDQPRAAGGHDLADRRRLRVDPGRARPPRRRRPPRSRPGAAVRRRRIRSTQHRSARRASITSRASRASLRRGAGLALQPRAERARAGSAARTPGSAR